ncbi:hypothetical protein ABEB36_011652 [Hypothenemus hampei]|uniref:Uncharacterized protein n=1 Tax=Hypothenemus hampei TaxID=57062 RepID=A0ABD1E8J3_HYPHA
MKRILYIRSFIVKMKLFFSRSFIAKLLGKLPKSWFPDYRLKLNPIVSETNRNVSGLNMDFSSLLSNRSSSSDDECYHHFKLFYHSHDQVQCYSSSGICNSTTTKTSYNTNDEESFSSISLRRFTDSGLHLVKLTPTKMELQQTKISKGRDTVAVVKGKFGAIHSPTFISDDEDNNEDFSGIPSEFSWNKYVPNRYLRHSTPLRVKRDTPTI